MRPCSSCPYSLTMSPSSSSSCRSGSRTAPRGPGTAVPRRRTRIASGPVLLGRGCVIRDPIISEMRVSLSACLLVHSPFSMTSFRPRSPGTTACGLPRHPRGYGEVRREGLQVEIKSNAFQQVKPCQTLSTFSAIIISGGGRRGGR